MFNYAIKGYDSYIFALPTHGNLGDTAISIAELLLLKDIGITPKEITADDYKKYKKIVTRQCYKKLVFLHGGGNMGNVWWKEEELRRDILANIKASHFILFPQTIFYTDSLEGFTEKRNSISIYSNRKDLSIFVREKASYDIATRLYKNTAIFLVPDIAFYLVNKYSFSKERKSRILMIMRNDVEKLCNDPDKDILNSVFYGNDIIYSDTVIPRKITNINREKELLSKLNEFSSSKLVITDRLHAMVFSYITGTPCMALDNNSHKVSGVYEWIKHCGFIVLSDSFDEKDLNNVNLNNYTKNAQQPLDFSLLKDVILKHIKH